MLQVLPVPHDILGFYRYLRRRRGYPPVGLVILAWPAICSAAVSAVGLRWGGPRRTILISKFDLFRNFEYYFYTVLTCQRYTAPLFGEYVEDKCYRRCPCRTISSSFAGLAGVAGDTLQHGKGSGVASDMQRCCFGGWLTTSMPPPHDIYWTK